MTANPKGNLSLNAINSLLNAIKGDCAVSGRKYIVSSPVAPTFKSNIMLKNFTLSNSLPHLGHFNLFSLIILSNSFSFKP